MAYQWRIIDIMHPFTLQCLFYMAYHSYKTAYHDVSWRITGVSQRIMAYHWRITGLSWRIVYVLCWTVA
jgi:hypothetical protein